MTSTTSWHYTTFGVLVGVGAGYLIGVLSVRWLWKRPPAHRPHQQAQSQQTDLVAALVKLTEEVAGLRQALEQGGLDRASRRSLRTVESVSDFVSARGDPDSEEEMFFDTNNE